MATQTATRYGLDVAVAGDRRGPARLLDLMLRAGPHDLTLADLTGADLRGADLRGADLTQGLFVTQAQLDAAEGDTRTGLPPSLARPAHWPGQR